MQPLRIERKDCSFMLFPDDVGLNIQGYVKDTDTAKQIISDAFHYLWYVEHIGSRKNIFWFGWRLIKNPMDLWIYQEIISEIKPDVIIETGTYEGGSALYFATLLDFLEKGLVITIDINEPRPFPCHDKIEFICGSSLDKIVIKAVEELIKPNNVVLVILDSLHSATHVLREMEIYSRYVTPGSYLIVEDTNLGGNPVIAGSFGGPMVAVKKFLKNNKNFVVDRERERFRMTFSPNGFLRRI